MVTSNHTQQPTLFGDEKARSLLDQLLLDSKLYKQSKDYKDLLDFVIRLRNFAPFNAMLLQVQKPGISYAASAPDWRDRFERTIKEGARPLLILWPFGPVALVYDVQDTEGKKLPDGVSPFYAIGIVDENKIVSFVPLLKKKKILWNWFDGGDNSAGSIQLKKRSYSEKELSTYQININRNHTSAVQFATLSHELGHLFLGHLGQDKKLIIPDRPKIGNTQRELEAESVSYLVCERNGVKSKSETYLNTYVTEHTTVEQLDLYRIMRAAGQVEEILGLTAHTKYDKPQIINDEA